MCFPGGRCNYSLSLHTHVYFYINEFKQNIGNFQGDLLFLPILPKPWKQKTKTKGKSHKPSKWRKRDALQTKGIETITPKKEKKKERNVRHFIGQTSNVKWYHLDRKELDIVQSRYDRKPQPRLHRIVQSVWARSCAMWEHGSSAGISQRRTRGADCLALFKTLPLPERIFQAKTQTRPSSNPNNKLNKGETNRMGGGQRTH